MSDFKLNAISYERNNSSDNNARLCAHELFELQVERAPDAVAVICDGKRLSYGELNAKANQVAHYLRNQGIGPEVLVGVCLERSLEMVIGLLGIWKSGGAYVPIDPAYPADRVSYMCSDSGARVLLTENKCKPLLPSEAQNTICLDSEWSRFAAEPTSNPVKTASPENLAYVMYTSGSTGKPKGAMILHGGLVNYLTWAIGEYRVSPGSCVPVHSSISFDLTVTSLYTPLMAGAQVELLREEANGQHLLSALRNANRRALVKITPAHLQMLNQILTPGELAGVTDLFVIGGEQLLAEMVRPWREHAPNTRLINEYGPTETVVGCCVYEVQPKDAQNGPVAIGRAIANTQLYVLGEDRKPVPEGQTGELYIGGAGVARGYLNKPELTAKVFLPDPFAGVPGARMYKTGDLARQREDGTLEYLGRVDNQVKVLGYRIELGEIEAAIASHAGVEACAVIAREDEPGSKQLVGYVVARKNHPPRVDELREFVAKTLPQYMVPARIVIMDALPLTENGKVDRKALPAPASEAAVRSETFVAPSSEDEKTLARIFAGLLNVQQVGIHDDFFELGGHSLMAIKAVNKIRDAFGIELPLATLLQAATVAKLVGLVTNPKSFVPSWNTLVPIRREGSRSPLFLFHAHGGNVLEYYPLANRLDGDLPVYGFQARGLNGEVIHGASLKDMAAAYVAELKAAQPKGPYYLGGFCLGGLLALEAAQQLRAEGQKIALLVIIQSIVPAAIPYRRGVSALQRFWYSTTKRIDLELDNFKKGDNRALDRLNYTWNRAAASIELQWDRLTGTKRDPSKMSLRYILQALGREHQRAMMEYEPQPYDGDVLLFRANKQLKGQIADEMLGWKDILRGKCEVFEVPGHQQQILVEPAVSEMAKVIMAHMKKPKRLFATSRGA
jgi:amino acid adenylation domain-containing protein